MDPATPAHDHDLWERVAHDALHSVQLRQERLIETYRLISGEVRYFWSLDDCAITWSRNGNEFLRGRITCVGSVDPVAGDWQWAWANRSLPPEAIGDMARVRRYGEEHAFPLLTWDRFRADPKPVTQAHMMSAEILSAEGVWRDRGDGFEVFFLVHDLRQTGPPA